MTEAKVPMLENLRSASEFTVLADVIRRLSKRRELILVLLPGNYSKSEDLWQSSLRPFYANAKFKQWINYKPD